MKVIIVTSYEDDYIKQIFICKNCLTCYRKFDELFHKYADKSGLDSYGDDVLLAREREIACFEKANVVVAIYDNVEVV